MQTNLFDALRRAGCGENKQGAVFLDGSEAYRHWVEDEIVFFEVKSGSDAAFANQDVQFDDNGITKVTDINSLSRDVRVLVLVPFSRYLKTLDLINPPPSK